MNSAAPPSLKLPKLEQLLHAMLLGCLIAIALCGLINIPFGFEPEVLPAFDVDELLGFNIAHQGIQHRKPFGNFGIYEHGSLPQALTYFFMRGLARVGYAYNDRFLVLMLRYLSFIPYLAAAALVYAMVYRRLGDRFWALVGALVFAATPDVYHYAQIIHPDLLQVFLVVASVYMAFFHSGLTAVLIGGSLVGFAMAAKLNALYLAPFLPLPWILTVLSEQRNSLTARFARVAFAGVAYLCVVLASFFLVNPEAFFHFNDFVARIQAVAGMIAQGWAGQTTRNNPLLWFVTVAANVSMPLFVLLCIGVALETKQAAARLLARRERPDPYSLATLTLLAYMLLSFVYLMAQVRMREFRYLYHILPFFVVLGVTGLANLTQALAVRYGSVWPRRAAVLALSALLVWPTIQTLRHTSWMSARYSSGRLTYVDWIVAHYPSSVTVALDRYVYFNPVRLPNSHTLNEHYVLGPAGKEYQLFVVSKDGFGRYGWKVHGASLRDGKFEIRFDYPADNESLAFLKKLGQAGSAAWWKLVYEADEVIVLENLDYKG